MEFINGLIKLGFKTIIIPKRTSTKVLCSKRKVKSLKDSSKFYELTTTNEYEKSVLKVFPKNTLISLS